MPDIERDAAEGWWTDCRLTDEASASDDGASPAHRLSVAGQQRRYRDIVEMRVSLSAGARRW